MKELIAQVCCCDTVTSGDDVKMEFNPGRLVGAVVVAGAGFGLSYLI